MRRPVHIAQNRLYLESGAMDHLSDLATVLAATIAGLFALVSAFLAWRLRNLTDGASEKIALAKEQRNEVKNLYTEAYSLFEKAISGPVRRWLYSF